MQKLMCFDKISSKQINTILEYFDKFALFFLAICPILQHYKGLFRDASTVTLVLFLPYFAAKLLLLEKWNFIIWPLILLSVFQVLNHGIGLFEFARESLLIVYFLAAASGAINIKYYIKVATHIAVLAGLLLLIQYFCFYLFDTHLQMISTGLLKDRAEQWILLAQTGTISVNGNETGFYRPSAFFLEPSHLTLFTFPLLAINLLAPNMHRKRFIISVILTLSLILSTSGMGIGIAVALWGLFVLRVLLGEGTFKEKLRRVTTPKVLIVLGTILVIMILLYFCVPFLNSAVNRIFVSESGKKNAIMGRMATGLKVIKNLSGWELLIGKSNWGNVNNWTMSGIFYSLYTDGIIGMLLSYLFYIKSAFTVKNAYFWISIIIFGLSLVTIHTHAAFYMMYFVFILIDGYPRGLSDKLIFENKFRCKFRNMLKKVVTCGGNT